MFDRQVPHTLYSISIDKKPVVKKLVLLNNMLVQYYGILYKERFIEFKQDGMTVNLSRTVYYEPMPKLDIKYTEINMLIFVTTTLKKYISTGKIFKDDMIEVNRIWKYINDTVKNLEKLNAL